MQSRHALLPYRIVAFKRLQSLGDGVVVDILNQLVRGLPCLFIGFAHNHMQAYAKAQLAPMFRGFGLHLGQLFFNRLRRLTPSQVQIHLLARELVRRCRRTAKIQRWARLLQRQVIQARLVYLYVFAMQCDLFAFKQTRPHLGKFVCGGIALFMA